MRTTKKSLPRHSHTNDRLTPGSSSISSEAIVYRNKEQRERKSPSFVWFTSSVYPPRSGHSWVTKIGAPLRCVSCRPQKRSHTITSSERRSRNGVGVGFTNNNHLRPQALSRVAIAQSEPPHCHYTPSGLPRLRWFLRRPR